jgi:preflagellin peptidase FlaK
VFATVPDLLRLLAVPAFGWIAYRDVRTRRIPNRVWYPLAALAVVLLVWELLPVVLAGAETVAGRRRLVRTGISVGIVVPLAYGFWLVGGFGGADAKAFFVVALLFPTYPSYNLWEFGVQSAATQLPVVQTTVGVFSLTILSNTVLLGLAYPAVLAARNAATGYVSPGMFVAKPVAAAAATEEYGTLLEFPDRSLTDDLSPSGIRAYFSYRGLDLDALRMYLRWRGLSFAAIRDDPDRYRDPDSLPAEPNDPGDGSMATDGGSDDSDDPWGADAFLADIDGTAYGTTPEALRNGLDLLTERDTVWVSPGIPFLVPLLFGVLVSLVAGDLLFFLLGLAGVL